MAQRTAREGLAFEPRTLRLFLHRQDGGFGGGDFGVKQAGRKIVEGSRHVLDELMANDYLVREGTLLQDSGAVD